MYDKVISNWKKSKKILFISSEKKGMGKQYLVNKISKDFEIIKCDPKDISKHDNIGINIMFNCNKKKLVIYNLDYINIKDVNPNTNIKIIVIINSNYILNKINKIIKKHIFIKINLSETQCIEILKKYIDLDLKDYKTVINSYDYNLNSIISNKNNIKDNNLDKKSDTFYDNSLDFINEKKIYNLSECYNKCIEYQLIGLHLIDYDNISIQDKLNNYDSYLNHENFKLSNYNNDLNIFHSFVIPYLNIKKYDHEIINYNKYISKSLIYINIINQNIDPYIIYKLIIKYKKDKDIHYLKKEVIKINISKKNFKNIIKLYDKIYNENYDMLLQIFNE
tara:strand:+ start:778 stop:1782 length:1005 start_codon:yes stop_codon:yes gene_type:complete